MEYARRLQLKGLYNARDLGGFPTAGGGCTRFGVFVRSEAPCELEQADIQALAQYGVTASIDLRSTPETVQRPSSLRETMAYYHRPLFHEAAVYNGTQPSAPPKRPHGASLDWGKMYQEMAEESRDWAIEVLRIAAEEPGAVLYHCTTGKDRTGLLTCYLLSIAGVPREDIAADYCVSELFLAPVYEKLRGQLPGGEDDADDPFFHTPAAAMFALIDYLTERYGGVTAYLREIGVSDGVISRIRTKLL
jgi:protein-tyrosine phosphatase